ncbi:hypothetical protein C7974DRAFT_410033 [Boeremia exigua]|uniref:uncharacterized protein n=1 Tax=Boeremia exigua TaxID=749465 RepID=UPI001E8D9E41|nr:uncharacterized protein C7974DRAFT_410033 [Boeremia exigua]KAH6639039.1 hypothetical protein C7974DRAFT_410033 [Boeremia exigua]
MKSREEFHEAFKESVDADLKQVGYDDLNRTWHSIRMFTKVIATQFARGANSDLPKKYRYEYDLRELWYWILQSARYIAADHPAQDRLVMQVLHTREMGVLSRKIGPPKKGEENAETEIATTSDGNIWSDLPFLAPEVKAAWTASTTSFPSVDRHNLSAFVARLASVGVRDPELGLVAIWILRDTLETPRPLTRTETDTNDSENQPAAIVDLLPAATAWFLYCGHKIESLCIQNQNFGSSSKTGELARRAEIEPDCGFSVARWTFWRDRLDEIRQCGDREVAQLAEKAHRTMKAWGERIETTD